MLVGTKTLVVIAGLAIIAVIWSVFISYMIGTSYIETGAKFGEQIAWALGVTIVGIAVTLLCILISWMAFKDEQNESFRKGKLEVYEYIRKLSQGEIENMQKMLEMGEIDRELYDRQIQLNDIKSQIHQLQEEESGLKTSISDLRSKLDD